MSSSTAPNPAPSRPAFTPTMRDRQARSKNPQTGLAESNDDVAGEDAVASKNASFSLLDDSYEARERRRMAATILDSPELLMMYAQSRGDSVPGTRHYFTKMLCGYEDAQAGDGVREREREKKRAASDISDSQGLGGGSAAAERGWRW